MSESSPTLGLVLLGVTLLLFCQFGESSSLSVKYRPNGVSGAGSIKGASSSPMTTSSSTPDISILTVDHPNSPASSSESSSESNATSHVYFHQQFSPNNDNSNDSGGGEKQQNDENGGDTSEESEEANTESTVPTQVDPVEMIAAPTVAGGGALSASLVSDLNNRNLTSSETREHYMGYDPNNWNSYRTDIDHHESPGISKRQVHYPSVPLDVVGSGGDGGEAETVANDDDYDGENSDDGSNDDGNGDYDSDDEPSEDQASNGQGDGGGNGGGGDGGGGGGNNDDGTEGEFGMSDPDDAEFDQENSASFSIPKFDITSKDDINNNNNNNNNNNDKNNKNNKNGCKTVYKQIQTMPNGGHTVSQLLHRSRRSILDSVPTTIVPTIPTGFQSGPSETSFISTNEDMESSDSIRGAMHDTLNFMDPNDSLGGAMHDSMNLPRRRNLMASYVSNNEMGNSMDFQMPFSSNAKFHRFPYPHYHIYYDQSPSASLFGGRAGKQSRRKSAAAAYNSDDMSEQPVEYIDNVSEQGNNNNEDGSVGEGLDENAVEESDDELDLGVKSRQRRSRPNYGYSDSLWTGGKYGVPKNDRPKNIEYGYYREINDKPTVESSTPSSLSSSLLSGGRTSQRSQGATADKYRINSDDDGSTANANGVRQSPVYRRSKKSATATAANEPLNDDGDSGYEEGGEGGDGEQGDGSNDDGNGDYSSSYGGASYDEYDSDRDRDRNAGDESGGGGDYNGQQEDDQDGEKDDY